MGHDRNAGSASGGRLALPQELQRAPEVEGVAGGVKAPAARIGAPGRPAGAPAAGHGSGHGMGTGAPHGSGRRVLVIEDEPNISEAIRFILRRDGWGVELHPSGEGALARIAELAPDLLILDVMLPGQSGFDVLRALRAEARFASLPVILLTARGQASTRELAHDHGASLFMPKPFANTELLAAVRQLVGV